MKKLEEFSRVLSSNKFFYLIFSLRQKYYQLYKSIEREIFVYLKKYSYFYNILILLQFLLFQIFKTIRIKINSTQY